MVYLQNLSDKVNAVQMQYLWCLYLNDKDNAVQMQHLWCLYLNDKDNAVHLWQSYVNDNDKAAECSIPLIPVSLNKDKAVEMQPFGSTKAAYVIVCH